MPDELFNADQGAMQAHGQVESKIDIRLGDSLTGVLYSSRRNSDVSDGGYKPLTIITVNSHESLQKIWSYMKILCAAAAHTCV
jgi:hypothetical protein